MATEGFRRSMGHRGASGVSGICLLQTKVFVSADVSALGILRRIKGSRSHGVRFMKIRFLRKKSGFSDDYFDNRIPTEVFHLGRGDVTYRKAVYLNAHFLAEHPGA